MEFDGGAADQDRAGISILHDALERPRQQFKGLDEFLPEFRHCATVSEPRLAGWSSVYVGCQRLIARIAAMAGKTGTPLLARSSPRRPRRPRRTSLRRADGD